MRTRKAQTKPKAGLTKNGGISKKNSTPKKDLEDPELDLSDFDFSDEDEDESMTSLSSNADSDYDPDEVRVIWIYWSDRNFEIVFFKMFVIYFFFI